MGSMFGSIYDQWAVCFETAGAHRYDQAITANTVPKAPLTLGCRKTFLRFSRAPAPLIRLTRTAPAPLHRRANRRGGSEHEEPGSATRTAGFSSPGAQPTCMPRGKAEFERLHPCDFYEPAELLEPDLMYTVYEIARLLQELEPEAELDPETEEILLDWAIPWIMRNSEELVVAEPPTDEEPGYYGLKTDGDLGDE